jgi:hypothetical protein
MLLEHHLDEESGITGPPVHQGGMQGRPQASGLRALGGRCCFR